MRIVYLHQYYNTDRMAGSTRSAEMARRFAAAGHEVHVVTSVREAEARGRGGWRKATVDGYTVHWCPVPYRNQMGTGERMRAFFSFALRASGRAASLRGDVVFATSTPLTIAIPGAYAAWRARSPMILEVRDLWPEVPIAMGALRGAASIAAARLLERWAYRHATRIVALSPGMKAGVVATGVAADRVSVVPNGCDLQLFAEAKDGVPQLRASYPWLGPRRLVLYAGTVGRVNGLGYMVQMAHSALSRDPEIRFVVLGDGAEVAAVRAEAMHCGVWERNFFLLPPVAKREVAPWFGAADLVCSFCLDLPELRANSANKFFDGLAAGRPVAINYLGWQADLLSSRGAGLLLPPGLPREAAQIVVDALADPSRLAEMGRASRQVAEREFDRDRLAEQLLAVLESVVA